MSSPVHNVHNEPCPPTLLLVNSHTGKHCMQGSFSNLDVQVKKTRHSKSEATQGASLTLSIKDGWTDGRLDGRTDGWG